MTAAARPAHPGKPGEPGEPGCPGVVRQPEIESGGRVLLAGEHDKRALVGARPCRRLLERVDLKLHPLHLCSAVAVSGAPGAAASAEPAPARTRP